MENKNQYQNRSDEWLLEKWIETKDENAFLKMYDNHNQCVLNFAYQMLKNESLAEEVMQNTFVLLIQNPEKFITAVNLRNYLIEVACNLIKQIHKRKDAETSYNDIIEESNFLM